ncbi:MAG: adenylate kinase family protein [Candidatus Thermoplasmatota archaeon]|nr:adenylate kinase family protein [Candidatus Thermoplasmatota archaeon]
MIIAITGTPGTGKTTVASILKKKGFTVVDLKQVAFDNDFIIGFDKERNSSIVDVKKLDRYIKKKFFNKDIVFVEGHIAHLLTCIDKIIILRLHPSKLKEILVKRKWKKDKIRENVEAEILDVILCEGVDIHTEKNCFEIDGTKRSINDIVNCILELVDNKFKDIKKYKIGEIDWSDEILKDL